MKLATLITSICLLLISTTVSSQTIKFNIKAKDKQIVEILKEIEESSKFRFFYIREQVDVERLISIKKRNASIDELLTSIFKDQSISFQIMDDYLILGACNPPLAHQALSSETDIGLLLPCNVIVYQGEDVGTSVVAVLDPKVQLGVTGRSDIDHLAEDVRARMEKVLAAL